MELAVVEASSCGSSSAAKSDASPIGGGIPNVLHAWDSKTTVGDACKFAEAIPANQKVEDSIKVSVCVNQFCIGH